jgi:hypothetical protein
MICAINIETNPKDIPSAINKIMSDTPVTISGLMTGKLFTVNIKFLTLGLILNIPIALNVPISVEISVEIIAIEKVVINAATNRSLSRIFAYHLNVKLDQAYWFFELLKEYVTRTDIGKYKNNKTSVIYALDSHLFTIRPYPPYSYLDHSTIS